MDNDGDFLIDLADPGCANAGDPDEYNIPAECSDGQDNDGDGWIDFVAGGAWYENSKSPREKPFTRHVFDPQLKAVHDLIFGDVDGDGRLDLLTMSDQNDLRWYTIPADGAGRWTATRIGDPTHSGISLGDLDADGDLDLVRSNVWFENDDHGRRWTMHKMTEPWGAREPPFAVNATQTKSVDVNGDGRSDLVVPCAGASSVSVLYASSGAPGTFLTPVTVSAATSPVDAAIGDIDGDRPYGRVDHDGKVDRAPDGSVQDFPH